jgi:hypothetical protein
MSDYPEIAARFARDTAGHEMTVLHDNGLYRHLRFSRPRPESSMYWFDLITWPGCLTIRGDIGESYTFNRLPDMFQFFRSDRQWGINQSYWAEKLDAGRDSVKEYNEELFRQLVCELFVDAVRYSDAPAGLGKAVREEILNSEFLADENEARGVLDSFEYKGFRFRDTWELSFHDYEWTFLWACYAIHWGIGQYDKVRKYGLQQLAVGDLIASAVAEERCLKAPVGCGQPLVGTDGSARVFWDEDEAARYAKEWRTTGLCPDCQDAAEAVAS